MKILRERMVFIVGAPARHGDVVVPTAWDGNPFRLVDGGQSLVIQRVGKLP